MPAALELTGEQFGRLYVLRRATDLECINKKTRNRIFWLCVCECGRKTVVYGSYLKRGEVKSCGCLVKKHGHASNGMSKTYISWDRMKQRCMNPNDQAYYRYGGRGITVCGRWIKFTNFLEDMGQRPLNHQLDRIDNNEGYYKENCRWVTAKVNNRNKHNNHMISFNSKTQCINAWAEECNIPGTTIRTRIEMGWSVEKTLTTPSRVYKIRNKQMN